MHRIAMPALEPGVSSPLLPARIYKLPLVRADFAALWRLFALRVLRATLCADEVVHQFLRASQNFRAVEALKSHSDTKQFRCRMTSHRDHSATR